MPEGVRKELKRFEDRVLEVKAQLEEIQASNGVLIEQSKIAWGVAKMMRRMSYVPLGAAFAQFILGNLSTALWVLSLWALMRSAYRYLDELTDHWYDRVHENLDRADEVMKGW